MAMACGRRPTLISLPVLVAVDIAVTDCDPRLATRTVGCRGIEAPLLCVDVAAPADADAPVTRADRVAMTARAGNAAPRGNVLMMTSRVRRSANTCKTHHGRQQLTRPR